eukprot:1175906-Prorocentrum_minimum.AAC.1
MSTGVCVWMLRARALLLPQREWRPPSCVPSRSSGRLTDRSRTTSPPRRGAAPTKCRRIRRTSSHFRRCGHQ